MRVASMLICIVLVGITLGSLGFSYLSYQEDINEIDKKTKEAFKEWEETGGLFPPDSWYNSEGEETDKANQHFRNVAIIHGVIILFVALAEIGILWVLPSRPKTLEITTRS